jgi:hypothetical protein
MGAPSAMFAFGNAAASTGASLFGGKAFNTFTPTANPMAGVQSLYQQSVDTEAANLNKQGDLAQSEAGMAALQKARDVKTFRENQANAYSGSGVLLEGSPMLVLENTRRLGQQEVDAIINRGQAMTELYRKNALITANQGRATILGQNIQFGAEQATARIQALTNSNRLPAALGSFGSIFTGLGIGKGNAAAASTTGMSDPIAEAASIAPSVNQQYGYQFNPWQM